jgi:hypothetical protein
MWQTKQEAKSSVVARFTRPMIQFIDAGNINLDLIAVNNR